MHSCDNITRSIQDEDAMTAVLSQFEEDLSARLWFSYRTGFSPLGAHPHSIQAAARATCALHM